MQKLAMSASLACRDKRLSTFSLIKKTPSLLRTISKIRLRSYCTRASLTVISLPIVPSGHPRVMPNRLAGVDVSHEPALEVLPGLDLVVDMRGVGTDLVLVAQEQLVDDAFLASEIVVELAFAGPRGFDDLIGARGAHALFVEKIGRPSIILSLMS
jgi:hypothetical protein